MFRCLVSLNLAVFRAPVLYLEKHTCIVSISAERSGELISDLSQVLIFVFPMSDAAIPLAKRIRAREGKELKIPFSRENGG